MAGVGLAPPSQMEVVHSSARPVAEILCDLARALARQAAAEDDAAYARQARQAGEVEKAGE